MSPVPLKSPALPPLPLRFASDDHDLSESESEIEASALQPEIDEQSDDEDDRQAHLLLRAAPTSSAATPLRQSPAVLQIDPLLLHTAPTSSTTTSLQQSPVALQLADPSFVVCAQNVYIIRT